VAAGTTNDNVVDEYVELTSISAQPLPLLDPDHPENTWHLDGGISFQFPTQVTLFPQATLLLVSFDPQADAVKLSAFRARYNVAAGVPVFGPLRRAVGQQVGRSRNLQA
jgi:hypothetical protein